LGAVPSGRCDPLSLQRPKQSFGEVRTQAELEHERKPGAAFEPIRTAGRLHAFAAISLCGDKWLSPRRYFFRPNAGMSVGKPTRINKRANA
jgi:hypothetical protein